MCGIFGVTTDKTNAAEIVFEGLKTLEYRGYDSWGVAIKVKSEKLRVEKHVGKIGDHILNSELSILNSRLAIGHTRWATHGGVTQANAHPHLDCTGKIAIVHNGIIEDFVQLKKDLVAKGHIFVSETDSEVVSHLIEDFRKEFSLSESARKAFLMLNGLNAIMVLSSDGSEIVALRNGSPLVIGLGVNENFVASDPTALLSHTKEVYFLEDGEMAIITSVDVKVSDIQTGKPKIVTPRNVDWNMAQARKEDFAHFMLKEMHEQSKTIVSVALDKIDLTDFDDIRFVGCGSAYHAAMAAQFWFAKFQRHQTYAHVASEFGRTVSLLSKTSIVIAISQSGETMDLLVPVKLAKNRGAYVIALTNVVGSSLYRLADRQIILGVGPEIAVASTKAFTGMLSHLYLLAGGDRKDLTKAFTLVTQILQDKKILALAKILQKESDIFVLGRGISYVASLELALKLKEIGYVHAEGMASGELKHGTLALVQKGTPCIFLLPNDETHEDNLGSAREVKARGGKIIAFSYKSHELFDEYIHIPDCADASIIPMVIAGQKLAYELALERGNDPDMPRNLAKSVTVK